MLATCDAYVFLRVVGWLWLVGIRESVYVPSKWVSHSSSRKKIAWKLTSNLCHFLGKRVQKPTKKPTKKHQKPTQKNVSKCLSANSAPRHGLQGGWSHHLRMKHPEPYSPRLPPQNVTKKPQEWFSWRFREDLWVVYDEWMISLRLGNFLVGSTVAARGKGGVSTVPWCWVGWPRKHTLVSSSWSEITVVFMYVCFVWS